MSHQIARGTGVLATIGATAPFVGLFGTVWGIMILHRHRGAHHQPRRGRAGHRGGAACHRARPGRGVPAVVIYNHLARSIAAYRTLLTDASAQVLLLVSRQRRGRLTLSRAAE
jgi:biopolymer transport protein ExbB